MCNNCSDLNDVLENHYPNETADDDCHMLVIIKGTYYVRLNMWPTEISNAPTMAHLNGLIGN